MPLANALLTQEQLVEPEEKFPLTLLVCLHCTLVQIAETISPEKLFSDYLYFSSFSDTVLGVAKKLSTQVIETRGLDATSLVIEIGSNDGYLLQYYKQKNIPVLGIEPAANIARIAESERGVPTVCDFFSEPLAERLREQVGGADVIHANNVLAHVPDLNGVVRGVARLLKETGIVIIEVPHVKEMIEHRYFDTIYHEHLCYFSLTALDSLFCRHGLFIYDVDRLPTHGGTLRIYAGHKNGKVDARSVRVDELLEEETQWGVGEPEPYLRFRGDIVVLREQLFDFLRTLKGQDKRIAAYGASAKGSTLLNYFGIGRETIDYVVDRSTVKQSFYTPGTHLRIFPPEKLVQDLPDYTLLLTWNFADEILDQQAEYRRRGGKFIVPVPELQVIQPGPNSGSLVT
jgi:SAM-dependent methyltransferase